MKRITLFFLTVIFFLFGIFGISQAEEPHRSSQIRCYNDKFSPIPCKSTREFSCQGSVCVLTKNLSDLGSSGRNTSSTPAGQKTQIHSPKRKDHAGKGSPHPEDSQNRDIKLQTSPLALPAPEPAKPTVLSEPISPMVRPAQPMSSTTTTTPTVLPIKSNDTGNAPLQEPVSPTFSPSDPRDTEKLSESLRKALEQYITTRAASLQDDPNNPVLENDLQRFLDSIGRAYHSINMTFCNDSGTVLEGDERINRSREESIQDEFLRKDIHAFDRQLIDRYGLRLNEGQKDYLFQKGKTRINNYDPNYDPIVISTTASTPSQTSSEANDSSFWESNFDDDCDDISPPPSTTFSETSLLMTPPQQSGSQLSSTLKTDTPFPGLKLFQRLNDGPDPDDVSTPPQGDDDGNSSGWEDGPLVFDDPSGEKTEDASIIISGPETGGNFNGSGNFQETALPTVHETPALPVEDQELLLTGDLPPTGPQTDETKSPLAPNSDAEGAPVNAGETREEPLPDTPNFPGIPPPLTAGEALGDNFSTDEYTLSLPDSPQATDLTELEANFAPPEPIAADSVIGADPTGHTVGVTGENTGAAPVAGIDSFTTEAMPTIETTTPESFNDVMATDSVVTESSAPATSDVSVPTDVA